MKEKKYIIIVSIAIIILLVVGIVLFKNTNASSRNLRLNQSKLEKMNDAKLANLFYSIPKDNNLVDKTILSYQFVLVSANSAEEATKMLESVGRDEKLLNVKLQKETDYYYVVYQEYVSYRGTGDVTFKYDYLVFKKFIFDVKNNTINLKVFNNTDKIKEIFDMYIYLKSNDNMSEKLVSSEVKENDQEYSYTYYHFDTSYGDSGVNDRIRLYKSTIKINKETGKYEIVEEKMLREATGKMN